MDFYALTQQCSSHFQEKQVIAAIANTESHFNQFAIGVVGGSVKQPRNLQEAILTVRALKSAGRNFSVGLMQVNQSNFAKYGLTEATMFDPCSNIRAGASIFRNCFDSATNRFGNKYSYDAKLRLAASCYYSGNFTTGFKVDFVGQPAYVVKFYNNLTKHRGNQIQPTQPIPALPPIPVQMQSNQAILVSAQDSQQVKPVNAYASLIDAINEQKRVAQAADATEIPLPSNTETIQAESQRTSHSWDIFQEF